MDVILDANVFLNDLKFQGTHFAELFAYLRRTGDSLVIPTLVMEEVLERYKDRLKRDLNTAKSSWHVLAGTKMTSHPSFPHVDFDKEVQKYREQLLNPALGVTVLQYSDVGGIDINEIARRGIKRKKPASDIGEELRDVLLWFLLIQYARQKQRQVAFISSDGAFRKSKDEDDLHPDLAQEIENTKLPIHFYREMATFVTSQSLSHKAISEPWLPQFVNASELNKNIAQVISATHTRYGRPRDVSNDGAQFSEGTAYAISHDSIYAELKYMGRARLFFEALAVINNLIVGEEYRPFQNNMVVAEKVLDLGSKVTVDVSAVDFYIPHEHDRNTTSFDEGLVGLKSGATFVITNPPFSKFDKLFDFEAWLSARVEKETLVSWQVDRVRLIEVSDK